MGGGGVDPAMILAVMIGLYAAFALLGLLVSRAIRRGGLREVHADEPIAGALIAGYGEGPRGAVWAAAAVLYGMAAALLLGHSAEAIMVFCVALAMDIALFLTWPQRRAYVAGLTRWQWWAEIGTVIGLSACVPAMLALRDAGGLR